MSKIFRDPMHDEFAAWMHGFTPYGGGDFGELLAVARAVGDGDDGAYFEAWMAAADRLAGEAEAALARGHESRARALFLRASAFCSLSFHPLYGAPVDPRVLRAFGREMVAFDRAMALGPHPVTRMGIPLGDATMPAYFIPAAGCETLVRPLIIFTNGYDGTIPDMYFASAAAASQRGYHCLLFDGPGQGAMLYEQGVPLRPDWEVVIKAVVDVAETLPGVDGCRIALHGWSLGGYLAPRGASGEHRIAALVADPGLWSLADGFRQAAVHRLGVAPGAAANLGSLDEPVMQRMDAFIRGNRQLAWKVVQRGFWVHGVDNLRAYLASAEAFTMDGRASLIRCPTLITQADGDALAAGAPRFLESLTCRKRLLQFSAAEGADSHCEMANRSLANGRVLDWLDEQFDIRA